MALLAVHNVFLQHGARSSGVISEFIGYQRKLAVSSNLAFVKKYYGSSLKNNKALKVTINEAISTRNS